MNLPVDPREREQMLREFDRAANDARYFGLRSLSWPERRLIDLAAEGELREESFVHRSARRRRFRHTAA